MTNSQNKLLNSHIFISIFGSLLFALCSLLFIPDDLNAQPRDFPVKYLERITEDEEGGKIYFPSFVFAEPVRNEIYIIDSGSRIIIYTSDFYPLFTLGKRNGVEAPQGLTVDKEGNLYVAQSPTKDNPRNRISVFNACLKWDRDIYLEGFEGSDSFSPYRLAIDKNGNIYVSGSYHPNVLVLNNQGKLLDIISPEEEGRKAKLTNVTLDKTGRIYIVSEEEGHIYVYDENRKFLFKFGEKGGSSAKLSRPMAVGVDNRDGRIYVVDYMRHTVSAYDNSGKYIFEFGGLGWGEGWFQHPRDISVDFMGRILVADTFNNRIEVFQPSEKLKQKEINEKAAEEKPAGKMPEEKVTEQQLAKKETEEAPRLTEFKPSEQLGQKEIKEKTAVVKPAEEKITEEQLVEVETKEGERPIYIGERVMFEDIHFDFDKYDIRPDAMPILQKVASWVLKNTFAKISAEGHCDERGTNKYNLALGDRRAKATKDYLTTLGIMSNRIETLSYGKEKPFCTEKTEECRAKNRRVHLVILREASEE